MGSRKATGIAGRVAARRLPVRDFHASFGTDALGRPVPPATANDAASGKAAAKQQEEKGDDEEELFWRSLYLPEQGMFCAAPADLQLGTRLPVRPCSPYSMLPWHTT
jgi:hypothetical protein